MAVLKTYKCPDCGYAVQTEASGNYTTMLGAFYNFHCPDCHEIVDISYQSIGENQGVPDCPECGGNHLISWNPIDGHCPKCAAKMEEAPSAGILFAD